jgi:hypothetical protein
VSLVRHVRGTHVAQPLHTVGRERLRPAISVSREEVPWTPCHRPPVSCCPCRLLSIVGKVAATSPISAPGSASYQQGRRSPALSFRPSRTDAESAAKTPAFRRLRRAARSRPHRATTARRRLAAPAQPFHRRGRPAQPWLRWVFLLLPAVGDQDGRLPALPESFRSQPAVRVAQPVSVVRSEGDAS